VRRALIADHARIRGLLAHLEDLAKRIQAGAPPGPRFAAVLAKLASALDAHNAAEEAALRPLLIEADAWGPARVEQMLAEHAAEHAELSISLDGEPAEVARTLPAFAARLRAHMWREEATFLAGEVLRDDVVSLGPCS
jgi:iron-sulfur cluster repair protein YtfE (RIC family)